MNPQFNMHPTVRKTALDHTRILGATVEAIAANKADIFKPNIPALVGPGVPLNAIAVSNIYFL